jgi:beta-lactamase regulating signal transducer with metallopeptidase domain
MKCPSCGHQLKKPKRTFFGKLIKWIFILFNLFMIYALFKGMGGAGQVINEATSEAAQTGATIGAGIGAMMILVLWAIGDVILGMLVLFTRPKSS